MTMSAEQATRLILTPLGGQDDRDIRDILDVLLKARPRLSTGENVLLNAALAVWNGNGSASFADVIGLLDKENLARVLTAVAGTRGLALSGV
jgi:hypothetical protein